MKRDIYVTCYTKEGKLEFTQEEWNRLKPNPQKPLIFHREDGPAIEFSTGIKEWCINGRLHRLDGPAIEYNDGDRAWYIDGEYYSTSLYNQIINEVKSLPLELRLTDPRWWVREMK